MLLGIMILSEELGLGNVSFQNNFLNFNVRNFNVTEAGSLQNIIDAQMDQHLLDDSASNDGEVM